MSETALAWAVTRRVMNSLTLEGDRPTAYAEAVLAGEIVAGPHVRNACRRQISDLEVGHERGLRYDHDAARRAIRFYEERLRLSDGQFEGRPFLLDPSQDFIVGSLFGWKRADTTRRFRRAYVEKGKGNGKSPLVGGIGLYGLMADGEHGAQIYSAGATKDQAGILFRDAVAMVRKSPALAERIKMSGGEGREHNMAYLAKGSFFRPVSRETRRTGSGPRPHFALVDELHEHPDGGIVEMLERGFKFRRQPLLLMITNSGTDRNSVCWVEHEHAIKVAAGNREATDGDATYLGEPLDDSAFSYVCGLDPEDDPLTDPSCWMKANPLLGVTITEEYLAGVVAQGVAMPSKLNGILRLHFCNWTDAETAWMTRALLEPCLADFEPRELHRGKRAAAGVDLSATQDLTVTAYAVETGAVDVPVEIDGTTLMVTKPTFDCWVEPWSPKDTLAARAIRDKADYATWADKGFLHTTPGRLVDFRHVAARLADAASWLEIAVVAYDRYAYQRFETECEELGLSLLHAEHPQGGKKKGKPTEDMIRAAKAKKQEPEGLWMPASVKAVEEMILEGRVRFLRNPVLVSAIMSAVPEHDPWGNYWLAKRKSVNRIDAAVAACMALGAAASMPAAKEFELFFV